jgi:hypothetical protein
MTVLHHAGKSGDSPRLAAQDAYTRKQYSRKHFTGARRVGYLSALGLGYAVRSVASPPARRKAALAALMTLLGMRPPPFGEPPGVAFVMAESAPPA